MSIQLFLNRRYLLVNVGFNCRFEHIGVLRELACGLIYCLGVSLFKLVELSKSNVF